MGSIKKTINVKDYKTKLKIKQKNKIEINNFIIICMILFVIFLIK